MPKKSVFPHLPLMAACFCVCGCLLLSFPAEAVDPNIWYVTQNGGTETKDGTSWATAWGEEEFPAAILNADAGDEIWVAEGIYRPIVPVDATAITGGERGATFQLRTGVALYGGFRGTEDNWNDRDWENNVTVLTGDLGEDDTTDAHGAVVSADNISGDNSYTVVTGSNTDNSAVLDGFTVCGGSRGTLYEGFCHGGGMFNHGGSPSIINCTFSGNAAAAYGGGMYNRDSGSPTVTNCTFSGNAASYGGGLSNRNASSPAITNCIFSRNAASYDGGGMDNWETSSPTVTNCTFSENAAENDGGGMSNRKTSKPTVINCTFAGNAAATRGGGICNWNDSNPTITACTFAENAAADGGGTCNYTYSSPAVTDCTFSGNAAAMAGGGMFNSNTSSPTVTNCTFAGNSAVSHGGGMDNSLYSSPKVTNCTFAGNSANNEGGGMCNFNESNPTVTNCIFWGDTQEEIDGSATVTYSIVQGGSVYTGEGNGNGNPLLEPLHYNGGATRTCTIPANSPARNNGSWDANLWENISLDQRGVSRDIISPDMGAYECSPDLKILSVNQEGSGTVTCNPEGTPFGSWGNQWCYGTDGAGGGLFSSMANRTDGATSVIFTESPDFPWTFTEWSGDISGTGNTATVTMGGNRWVLAVFTRQCGIAASADTGGTIAPAGNVTVLSGNDQTFAVTPNSGHEVKDVMVDGSSVGAKTTYTFTNVTEDHTIAASFAVKPTSAPEPTSGPDPTAVPTPVAEPTTTPTIIPTSAPEPTSTPTTTPFPTPNPDIPLPEITLTLTLVGGGEIIEGPIEITLTEELLNALLLGNWISQEDFRDLLSGGYNSEILSLFSLAAKLDDGVTALTLVLEITVVTGLPEGYTYRIYLLGRTYDESGNPTGFTILADGPEDGAVLLRKRGNSETWKVEITDGGNADANLEEGYVTAEIGGIVVVTPETSETPTPSASGNKGGGGCSFGVIPGISLFMLPLLLLLRR